MFEEFLLLLLLAVLFVALFRRLRLPAILAYLVTGIVVGPAGLGLLTNQHQIEFIAELGVVFLMFSLGLEFSLPRLIAMRHWVLGLGGTQVLTGLLLFTGVGYLLSLPWAQALAIGAAIVMSSTAIVIKQFTEQKQLHTRRAQLSVSVLLFQDIAVVPFLIFIPLISLPQPDSWGLIWALVAALFKGGVAVLLILSVGKWILPRLFQEIASARSDELFVLTTLLVALLAGGITHLLGLSMALGAFLAGMMLGESHYRHQLEADIRPFRDVLMGLFFITIGMLLQIDVLWRDWPSLLLLVLGIMLSKTLLVTLLAAGIRERGTDALSTGLVLCQMGEFGFVLIALAGKYALIPVERASLLIGAGVLSMAATPYLIAHGHRIARRVLQESESLRQRHHAGPLPGQYTNHVLICGFGRIGQTVARFLKVEGIPYVAVDRDPVRVKEARHGGEKVEFGDASRREILLALDIRKAKTVVVTFDDKAKVVNLLALLAELAPNAKCLVKTKDDSYMMELQAAGAADVVPESLEGSLMIVSHVLSLSGVPAARVEQRLQLERKNHYRHLHGFFLGDSTTHSLEENYRLEQMRAVHLPERAYAIGKHLYQLNLRHTQLRGLRRNGVEIARPARHLTLKPDDVLILCGRAHHVERAELWLLEGS